MYSENKRCYHGERSTVIEGRDRLLERQNEMERDRERERERERRKKKTSQLVRKSKYM